jgi:hypothetical protein
MRHVTGLTVEFCGEEYTALPGQSLTIGREADIILDDENQYLHRRFLLIDHANGLWWVRNVGSQLSATVADLHGGIQAWLPPETALPLTLPRHIVWFTAGPTTYDFEIAIDGAAYESVRVEPDTDGTLTIGGVQFNAEQHLLVVALAEDILRHGGHGAGSLPTSSAAAARLGWPVTKFNRKLDYLCSKLDDAGVRGLHGGPGKLASARRSRLVEYALATRIVTANDLSLLPLR